MSYTHVWLIWSGANPFQAKKMKILTHLNEFEQTCTCLHIAGMSDETLRWKLFPFSLEGKAKTRYDQTAPSKDGDWKALCSSFCLEYFSVPKIVCLHLEILSFTQQDDESLIAA